MKMSVLDYDSYMVVMVEVVISLRAFVLHLCLRGWKKTGAAGAGVNV